MRNMTDSPDFQKVHFFHKNDFSTLILNAVFTPQICKRGKIKKHVFLIFRSSITYPKIKMIGGGHLKYSPCKCMRTWPIFKIKNFVLHFRIILRWTITPCPSCLCRDYRATLYYTVSLRSSPGFQQTSRDSYRVSLLSITGESCVRSRYGGAWLDDEQGSRRIALNLYIFDPCETTGLP